MTKVVWIWREVPTDDIPVGTGGLGEANRDGQERREASLQGKRVEKRREAEREGEEKEQMVQEAGRNNQ